MCSKTVFNKLGEQEAQEDVTNVKKILGTHEVVIVRP